MAVASGRKTRPVDVYFLADTTGSMRLATGKLREGIVELIQDLGSLPLDIKYGVGEYKDFPDHPYGWKHLQDPTDESHPVKAALAALIFTPGRDTPEAQFLALDQLAEPPGGPIGWRQGSKRFVVWIGDAAGHDPICSAVSGLEYDITEESVIAKLVKEEIKVIAVSANTNPRAPLGLDGDPIPKRSAYGKKCGPPGGRPGQGTRIGQATGGSCNVGVRPEDLTSTILQELRDVAATVGKVQLVASGDTAAYISAIEPAEGFGPLDLSVAQELVFDVRFESVSDALPPPGYLSGSLDIIADGSVVGGQIISVGRPEGFTSMTGRPRGSGEDASQERGRVMANVGSAEVIDRAGQTGRAAGTLWGALSGAGAGSAAMPVLGTLVGAVAGGLLGGGAGQWLGRAMLKVISGVLKGTAAVAGTVASAAGGSISTEPAASSGDTAGKTVALKGK